MKNILVAVLMTIGVSGYTQRFETKSLVPHKADTVYKDGVKYILRSEHEMELEILELMRNGIVDSNTIEVPAEYEDLFDEVMACRIEMAKERTFGTGICSELVYAAHLADVDEKNKTWDYIQDIENLVLRTVSIKNIKPSYVVLTSTLVEEIGDDTIFKDVGHFMYVKNVISNRVVEILEQNIVDYPFVYKVALTDTIDIKGIIFSGDYNEFLYLNERTRCEIKKVVIYAIENKIYNVIWKQKMQPLTEVKKESQKF